MSLIQIGIACGGNCEHYVIFLLNSIRRTVSGNNKIEIILGINRKSVDINFILERNRDLDIKCVYSIDEESISVSSKSHGRTLDKIIESMDNGYGMVVDCDSAFLKKNWDEIFISQLSNEIVIIGAEYDGDKYKKFPNLVTSLFKTEVLKEEGVSFLPSGKITIDASNCDLYSREVGDKITLDTGWELCGKLRKSGYKGIYLPLLRSGDTKAIFMQDNMRGDEYQLDGVPICTHVGRSSTRNFLSDPIVILWRERVERWLNENPH